MDANKEFYRSIGNMLAENLNGCLIPVENKKCIDGFESLKSVHCFLSNDFIERSKEKIDKLDGKIKVHLLNDLKRYKFFNDEIEKVIKTIDSINNCIRSEEDQKTPKNLIKTLKNHEGLISRIFEHIIDVLNDAKVFKNKKDDNIDLINEQRILFKKYRVENHEKYLNKAIANINCSSNDEVKKKASHILNESYSFLIEEAIDLFLY